MLALPGLRALRSEQRVIGLAEYVDIPAWRILRLRAKVDTGARSSALHVENLREVGRNVVRFDVRLHRSRKAQRVTVEALITRRARVRSSSGDAAARVFVEATICIGPVVERIELGLVDRARMIYRMLLGRTALIPHFIVDPGSRYLLTGPAACARPDAAERRRLKL